MKKKRLENYDRSETNLNLALISCHSKDNTQKGDQKQRDTNSL